ncbi:hypothetical protein CYY_003091 [Polysphondylium violaceum]|uniref:Integrator complex subunit 2 n=1 Tax=Polysphondylium violaceum TaxID=133409 RepID=A0A8J4PX69_9MYCE|nr:hypothetical protein CYY_003091 [Polysphondylium violaceum]
MSVDDDNIANGNENDTINIFDCLICGQFETVVNVLSANPIHKQQHSNLYLPYIYELSTSISEHQELLYSKLQSNQSIHSISLYYNSGIDYESINNDFIYNQFKQKKKLSHITEKRSENSYLDSIDDPVSLFENGQPIDRLKLILTDIIGLIDFMERNTQQPQQQQQQQQQLFKYECLFIDTDIYNIELLYIINIIIYRCYKYIDLKKLVLSMIYINQSEYILKIIVANNPHQFTDIVDTIITQCTTYPITHSMLLLDKIKKVLIELCSLSNYFSRYIRTQLLSKQILPDLVFNITVQFINDEIDLLGAIIANRSDNQWIKDSLSNVNSRETVIAFNKVRENLLSKLLNVSNSQQQSHSINESFTIKSILRLYCGFNGLLGIKMNQQEITASLSLMTINNQFFKNYSKIFLCFLLVCEGLVKTIQHKRVTEYLNQLSSIGNCQDLLLLVSIYFHTHQLHNIALVVKGILGFRPSIHTESLHQLGEVLTKEIYTESLVAKSASSLPIIENLNSSNQNISIMCVYHLLSERIFEKYETDVGEWVWKQTLKASTPIHYLLPSLLDQLVKNIIDPSISLSSGQPNTPNQISSTQPFYMKRIAETKIMQVIRNPQNYDPVVQVLVIYFAMRFNDSIMRLKSDPKFKNNGNTNFLTEATQLKEYSVEFLSKLPIQKCLSIIHSKQNEYFYIIPPFLYLISSLFPQFFNIGLLLLEEERASNPLEKFIFLPQYYSESVFQTGSTTTSTTTTNNNNNSLISIPFLIDAIKKTKKNPTSTQLILRFLNTRPTSELIQTIDVLIEYLLPILIQNRNIPGIECLIMPFSDLWCRVFPSSQLDIALKTINILTFNYPDQEETDLENEMKMNPISLYSHIDIISDPLLIFRCHPIVFTCPPLFKILLQIIFFYMVSSKKNLHNQIQLSNGKQEEVSTLILTQESLIVQILLEICAIDKISTPGLRKILSSTISITGNNQTPLYEASDIEEIRCQICNFIHQIFIEKPLIIKLIHFQGYHSLLLPITSALIPSMHICLEFIPELMNQQGIDKQIFSIQLLSYLCEKYPLPKSLKTCKQAFSRISFNLSGGNQPLQGGASSNANPNPNMISAEDKESFLLPILPSILKIVSVFPILIEDAIQILMEQLPIKNNYQQNVRNFIEHTRNTFDKQHQQKQNSNLSNHDTYEAFPTSSNNTYSMLEKEIHTTIISIIKNL